MTFSVGDFVWVPGLVAFPRSGDTPFCLKAVETVFPGKILYVGPTPGRVSVSVWFPVSDDFDVDPSVLRPRKPGDWNLYCLGYRQPFEAKQSEQEAPDPSFPEPLPPVPGVSAESCSELVGSGTDSSGVPGDGSPCGAGHKEG